jgi:PIN domain nuclease of toxin-antitoxin system
MRVLLDTNQVLFIVQDPTRLTDNARDLLWNRTTELFLSSVSLWEIDLKHRARTATGESRLPLATPVAGILTYFIRKGAGLLPLEPRHVATELETPLPHNDPFDWMHLKQAQADDLRLLTSDRGIIGHPLAVEA